MTRVSARSWKWLLTFLALLLAGSAGAVRKKVFDLPLGGVQIFERTQALSSDGTTVTTRLRSHIPKILGIPSANVVAEYYGGYHGEDGTLYDLSGNGRDAALGAGTAAYAYAPFFDSEGNSLQAAVFNGSTYNSIAHDSWMDMFDSDHTLTIVASVDASGTYDLFGHTDGSTTGMRVQVATAGYTISAYYYPSGGGGRVYFDADEVAYNQGSEFHVYHFVRDSNIGYGLMDGNARFQGGYKANLASKGVDGSATFYIGSSGSNHLNGKILYVRLQNSVMTYEQMQNEAAYFKGILAGSANGTVYPVVSANADSWSSANYRTHTFSMTGTPAQRVMPVNWLTSVDRNGKFFNTKTIANSGNLFYGTYPSRNVDASWTQNLITTSVDQATGIDGTAYLDKITETVGDGKHSVSALMTTQSGYYGSSTMVARPGTSDYAFMMHTKGGAENPVIFNIRKGTVVSKDTDWLDAGITLDPSGAAFMWGMWQGNGAAWTFHFGISNGTTYTYVGDVANYIYIGDMINTHQGSFPPHSPNQFYNGTTNLTYLPWGISKDVTSAVAATPALLLDGSENVHYQNCNTQASCEFYPKIGNYVFTNNGKGFTGSSKELGQFYHSDKMTSSLSGYQTYLPDPSGGNDFDLGTNKVSFVFIARPISYNSDSTAGMYLVKKGSGNPYWYIYFSTGATNNVRFFNNGSGIFGANGCVEYGKPSLVTFVYDGTIGGGVANMYLYADGTCSANALASPVVADNDNSLMFNSGDGELGLVAAYRNYAISAAEHAAMYTKFKKDGFLPLTIGSTAAAKKITVSLESRMWGFNHVSAKSLFEISGSKGASTNSKNLIRLSVSSGTIPAFTASLFDSVGGTQRYMTTANQTITKTREWRKHVFTFDFANLANSTYRYDGATYSSYANLTGTTLSLSNVDNLVYVGNTSTGAGGCDCEIRNVQISTE